MTFYDAIKQYRLHLAVVAALLVALYWGIVPDMVSQWYNDENYSHGFLVPIISGYFFWKRWPELKDKLSKPDNLGLVVIVLGLMQLLVAWLGSEYFTMRSSMIVLLVGMVLLLFGREILKAMALPLGYLLFMVPIPYIIYDMAAFPLKLFVTRVSVLTLKLVGVVVLREGNIIMFPTTTLEVADACSGIRSLISLLALAVAYAFFMQTSNLRRWILVASAVPIAIFTNCLRVIITGVLAQWWGAKAAEGFFHEFAGMAVFVLAMVMLVAFGAFLKGKSGDARKGGSVEEGVESSGSEEVVKRLSDEELKWGSGELLERITASLHSRIIVTGILMATIAIYMNLHQDVQVPMKKGFDQFPVSVSGWHMTAEYPMSDDIQKVLKASDTISRRYETSDKKPVDIYIGYHGGGKDSGGIHSPKHCLPGSGWYEASSKRSFFDVSGTRINLVQAVYQKGDNKTLFLYWFQARNQTMNEEYSLKLAEITNSMLYRRRDTAFIRISVPFETDQQAALQLGERFVKDFDSSIRAFLPE